MSLIGWLFRIAPRLLVAALCLPLAAAAATYTFRSDSYAWETAANVVSWDRTCTNYPNDDDKATLTFTGGFTFTFAGTAYGSVRVLANGMLQFGTDTGLFRTYTNTNLPAGTPSNIGGGCARGATTNAMMAYWTDLNPNQAGSGNVTWQQKGTAPNRYVVVSWNSVYAYNTSTPYAFQIILFENGEFKYQYGNGNATGSNATIGVQVSDSDYTLYSYNSGYNANGSAIRWFIPSGVPARVAEYRFDEFSWNGTVGEVRDSSGNDQHGVRVGSATNEANGVVCRRLNVPANTTTAISAIDTALDIDTGVGSRGTLSFWVRANANWNSGPAAMLASATMIANRPFNLFRTGSGGLTFQVADSAGKLMSATTPNLGFSANTWVHVAATWRLVAGTNQSTLRIYVNGVQQAVDIDTTNGNLDPSLGSLFIGDNRSTATATGATANSANGQLDEFRVYNFELSPAEIALDQNQTHGCDVAPHHLEIQHGSGSGLTCTPSTVTIVSCTDASCATRHTGGVNATLTSTGAPTQFPAGAAIVIPVGSSSVTVALQVTSPAATTLGISAASPAPSNATTCNFGSPSCTFTAADSGFLMSLPNHAANSSQTLAITAVRKADNAAVCVPAFANVSRSVALGCSYVNPATGTRPVRAGGVALNATANAGAACGGTQALNLAFDASGRATTTAQYADVGQVDVTAAYTGSSANGDTGLSLAGSASFIAAPASFAFSGVTAGPIKAGRSFAATLTALDSGGAATPNFGRETPAQAVTLSFQRAQPSGAGANDGSFSGSAGAFSGGSATAANLVWSEVGRGDLRAALSGASYLGSGLTASGSTGSAGAVGRFVPDHFDVVVTPSCSAFSYAGQPFAVRVMAMNGLATPGLTLNYDGSAATSPNFAQSASLSEAVALGVGSFGASASVAATAFAAGVANLTPSYAYTTKLTGERTLVVRLTDADAISSNGFAEGSTLLRSGRLRLANAFGSASAALQIPVLAEYWSGNAWVLNAADSCTSLPAGAVVQSNRRDHRGAATAAWSNTASAITVVAGRATLTLGAPSPAATGTVDLALNLGSSSVDQSCLAAHPASTGAARPWLRSLQGSCAATWDRDPAARASFGIYSPETRRTVHVRDLY